MFFEKKNINNFYKKSAINSKKKNIIVFFHILRAIVLVINIQLHYEILIIF